MSAHQHDRSPPTVMLRPVERPDIEAFFTCEHDPEANALAGVKPRERDPFMEHWERILADETVTERAILADGVVAGRIASFRAGGRLELGYWIGREFWGRGIAGRAVGLLLNEDRRRPLHAHVSAHNAASIRILERHGFVRTGETDEPETDRYRAGPVVAFRLD